MAVMHIFHAALLYLRCPRLHPVDSSHRLAQGEVAEAWKWSVEPLPGKLRDAKREALKASEAGASPADASTQ
ncbi:hypothetical protein FA95DRAFT_1609197 [Auriscalpium vulgare]|uniref:Uncharacterized protein n=1 Tax=Auriscalpium vulgare TaxID=40419 RepID=A0ACB8RJ32_9AGAM|nr:hypothetical protein FA95DRAFT_1609197 [Auriscalpium vulgare]